MTTGFEAVFREQFPRLVSLATALTGRRDVASELAQETMLRAHQHWDELAGYDAPGAWCRRVLVNLAIDQQRSSAAEQRAVARLGSAPAPSAAAPALDEWNTLVAALTDRQRTIVTLHYADDLSIDEIAAMLDVAPGTVKTTLFRARQSLLGRLTERSSDEEGSHHG